jgi:hypothetical protein
MNLQEKREKIAKLGDYKLITNFQPHVWQSNYSRVRSIAFDKHKNFGELIKIVDYLEQKHDLIIEIKRDQCIIKKMHLTSNRTLHCTDGMGSKQMAIFEALCKIEITNKD